MALLSDSGIASYIAARLPDFEDVVRTWLCTCKALRAQVFSDEKRWVPALNLQTRYVERFTRFTEDKVGMAMWQQSHVLEFLESPAYRRLLENTALLDMDDVPHYVICMGGCGIVKTAEKLVSLIRYPCCIECFVKIRPYLSRGLVLRSFIAHRLCRYYGVGASVWDEVSTRRRIDEIVDVCHGKFIEHDLCAEEDVRRIIEDLYVGKPAAKKYRRH
jgi:hypothetical protein